MPDLRRWFSLICVVVILSQHAADARVLLSIDAGGQFLKAGILKVGSPLEVALNDEGARKTPTAVAILADGERLFGEAAIRTAGKHPRFVFEHLDELLARNEDHPLVGEWKSKFPTVNLRAHPNRTGVLLQGGDGEWYAAEALYAMLLRYVKTFAARHVESTVSEAILTIPPFLTQPEKEARLEAAKLAGLDVLQLLSSGTAAALGYLVPWPKPLPSNPKKLLVLDVGAVKTTATLVELRQSAGAPELAVLGVGWDARLGGRRLSFLLRDKVLIARARKENVLDKELAPRTLYRLLTAAEKLKLVLSANVEHSLTVDGLAKDGGDFRTHVTRADFELLLEAEGYEERLTDVIQQAVKRGGSELGQIEELVLMGAGTRVPAVLEIVRKIATASGIQLSQRLNTDEAAAFGALWAGARLAKGLKIQKFSIIEKNLLAVKATIEPFDASEQTRTQVLLAQNSTFPVERQIIELNDFRQDFTVSLFHQPLDTLTDAQKSDIFNDDGKRPFASVHINGLSAAVAEHLEGEKAEENELKSVKLAYSVDESGVVRLPRAEVSMARVASGIVEALTDKIANMLGGTDVPEVEPKVVETAGEEKSKEGEKKAEEKDKVDESTKGQDKKEGAEENAEEGAEKKKELPKKAWRVRLDVEPTLPFVGVEFNATAALIKRFEKTERLRAERAEARNSLEALTIDIRDIVENDDFIKHSTEDERKALIEQAEEIRTWLEDEETEKSAKAYDYTQKSRQLGEKKNEIELRIKGPMEVEKPLRQLRETLNTSSLFVQMIGNGTQLFPAEDGAVFVKEWSKVSTWLEKAEAAEKKRLPHESVVLKKEDVQKRYKSLDTALNKLMRSMKTLDLKDLKLDGDEQEKDKKTEKDSGKKKKPKKDQEGQEEKTQNTKEEL